MNGTGPRPIEKLIMKAKHETVARMSWPLTKPNAIAKDESPIPPIEVISNDFLVNLSINGAAASAETTLQKDNEHVRVSTLVFLGTTLERIDTP
mmetsp:Transcript_1803/g.1791  ORF Transcript_1803/g.1791 Transcript_1803/m.1791 type:complete len:94 (-) Transcript_1803:902-1183(-)